MVRCRANHVLFPDYVSSAASLPLAGLKAKGIRVIVFDLDHTLAHGRTRQISTKTVEYLRGLSADGFRLLIASNSMSNLTHLADALGAKIVRPTLFVRKPFRSYYQRVITAAGCPPGEIAMVGDRIINDIVGANWAGLVTVKVDPLGRRTYFVHRLYDRLARSAQRTKHDKPI